MIRAVKFWGQTSWLCIIVFAVFWACMFSFGLHLHHMRMVEGSWHGCWFLSKHLVPQMGMFLPSHFVLHFEWSILNPRTYSRCSFSYDPTGLHTPDMFCLKPKVNFMSELWNGSSWPVDAGRCWQWTIPDSKWDKSTAQF